MHIYIRYDFDFVDIDIGTKEAHVSEAWTGFIEIRIVSCVAAVVAIHRINVGQFYHNVLWLWRFSLPYGAYVFVCNIRESCCCPRNCEKIHIYKIAANFEIVHILLEEWR